MAVLPRLEVSVVTQSRSGDGGMEFIVRCVRMCGTAT